MAGIQLPNDLMARLLNDERRLSDILAELDKAEECGVDCTRYRNDHAELLKRINALKRNYGGSYQPPGYPQQ